MTGELAGIRAHPLDPVERRSTPIVDGIHDVVQRAREMVDVLAIERRHKGPVQALDDLVGDEVALVLDFLDLIRLVPDGLLWRKQSTSMVAPSRICSAIATKSSKNLASRGINLNTRTPGHES